MSARLRLWIARLVSPLLALGLSAPAVHAREPPSTLGSALAPCGTGQAWIQIGLLEPPAAAAAPARDPVLYAALRDAICDWFRDDGWSVSFSGQAAPGEPPPGGLRIRLELQAALARLHVEAADDRSVRDVPLESGLDEAGVEAIAEAMHSTAQAASVDTSRRLRSRTMRPVPAAPRSNALAAPARDDTAPQAVDEPGRASRPTARGRPHPVHTALGYQAYARGAEPFMHGPALHIELDALSRPIAFAGFFRASLFTSSSRRASGFAVRSSGASLALGAAARLPLGGASLRAAASSGVDLIALDVEVIDPTLVRSVPAGPAAPRLFSGVEAGIHYGVGSFELGVDALARLLWADTRYQVRNGDRALTVFRPWQLQPGAVLALGYVW